jgi:sn-glycerol 3-phosphate transport system ATP-binding protein
MAYGLKIAKVPQNEIDQKVEDAAKLLQLEPYLERKPRELSGGQRQRVAMGRAIVREPAVFLFDEPLSNLDAKLRVQMRLEIKQLQANLGVTALYVTHDQVEAMTMADRMIVMHDGIAEQIGTPLEVYEKPATVFSAQFIGSPAMNIVEGHLSKCILTLKNGARFSIDKDFEGDVFVGIRPEHVVKDITGELKLKVKLAEPLGANTLYHGSLMDSEGAFTASVPGVHHVSDESDIINFQVETKNIHIFDGNTKMRVN